MNHLLTATFFTFVLIRSTAMGENQILDLVLPTDNDALFSGGGAAFYQYIERNFKGVKSTPWEGGQYGFVRDPIDTAGGVVYTRFHEGIDIRPLHRDAHGEPLDEVRAIADGKVVHANSRSRLLELWKIHRHRASLGRLKLLQFMRTSEFDRSPARGHGETRPAHRRDGLHRNRTKQGARASPLGIESHA
mgnify:CR=1 FL=1